MFVLIASYICSFLSTLKCLMSAIVPSYEPLNYVVTFLKRG